MEIENSLKNGYLLLNCLLSDRGNKLTKAEIPTIDPLLPHFGNSISHLLFSMDKLFHIYRLHLIIEGFPIDI